MRFFDDFSATALRAHRKEPDRDLVMGLSFYPGFKLPFAELFGFITAQKRYIRRMKSTFSRRAFLKVSAVAGAAVSSASVLAVEPFKRAGAPRLELSLAAYSFRDSFK